MTSTNPSKGIIYFIGNEVDREELESVFIELADVGYRGSLVHPNKVITQFGADQTTFYVDDTQIIPALVVGWVFREALIPGMYLLYAMERSGLPIINPAATLFCGQNKYLGTEALLRHGVPHFPVLSGFSDRNLEFHKTALKFPLVLKPIVGYGGGKMIRIDTFAELKNAAKLLAGFSQHYYVQPYLDKPFGRDIRVVCINYKAVYAYNRYAPPGEWVTNIVAGGRGEITKVTASLAEISEAACRSLGAQIAGVDVTEDPDGGFRVIEVNTCPALKIRKHVDGADNTVERALATFLASEIARRQTSSTE